MLRMTTRTPGSSSCSAAATCSPVMPGIVMSSTATSGTCSLAIASAWSPLAASATTSKPGACRNTWRMPSRTMAWSSAIRMRMGVLSSVIASFLGC